MSNNILLTTTTSVEGYHVEKYFGIISKELVFRNGLISALGAAVTNFVNSFNFRDVELKGSSELIANAKSYLMEQFEREARNKGANAVLGIDYETSFGVDLIKVSINGTAVKLVKNSELLGKNADVNDNAKKYRVKKYNRIKELVPGAIGLFTDGEKSAITMSIIKTGDYEVKDMNCDLCLHTRFGDEYEIKDVYFLNFKDSSFKTALSDAYPVDIPLSIALTLEDVSVITKRIICKNGVVEYLDIEMTEATDLADDESQNLQKSKEAVSAMEFFKGINNLQSIEDIVLYMQENASFFTPEEYADFDSNVQKEIQLRKDNSAQVTLVKKTMQNQLVAIINNRGGIVPVSLENNIQCPLCNKVQASNRQRCFVCGVWFSLPEKYL